MKHASFHLEFREYSLLVSFDLFYMVYNLQPPILKNALLAFFNTTPLLTDVKLILFRK